MTDTHPTTRRPRFAVLLTIALALATALTLAPPPGAVDEADAATGDLQIVYSNLDFAVRDSKTIDTFWIFDEPADHQLIIDEYRPCIITEFQIYTRHRFVLQREESPWYWPTPRWETFLTTDVPCAQWGPRYRVIEDLPPGKYRWRVFDARKAGDGNTAVDVFTIVIRQRGGFS